VQATNSHESTALKKVVVVVVVSHFGHANSCCSGVHVQQNLSGETSLALQRLMVLLLAGAVMLITGAEVDARTRGGMATPLHRAAAQGHGEVVKLL
jgi:hypothetical protein